MIKKTAILLSAAAAMLILILIILKPGINPENYAAGRIDVYFHLYSSPGREEFEKLLNGFSDRYPSIELSYHIGPYLDIKKDKSGMLAGLDPDPDHIVVSSSAAGDIPDNTVVSPGMWTGQEWKLFYNSGVLKDLGLSEEAVREASGNSLDEFIEAVSPALKPDQTLFSVSSRFFLQWLSWIQHIELERNNGRMPDSFASEKWSDAVNRFDELVEKGIINEDHRTINDAGAVLRMFKGDSLFVLSTDSIYSIFLPADREAVKSLSFPGSSRQGWIVGSGFYLTASEPEKISKEARAAERLFLDYLRSEEVISYMLKNTGIKLNPPRTRGMLKEIPSISGRAGDRDVQELIKFLQK